jgi:hypothetical protein
MASIVLLTLLWPLVHIALVERFRLDPWEFFGWSMYALPAVQMQIAVEAERAGIMKPLRTMGTSREEIRRLARRRSALGTLASVESTSREIFEGDPAIAALVFVFREIRLDSESALLVSQDDRVRIERTAEN